MIRQERRKNERRDSDDIRKNIGLILTTLQGDIKTGKIGLCARVRNLASLIHLHWGLFVVLFGSLLSGAFNE